MISLGKPISWNTFLLFPKWQKREKDFCQEFPKDFFVLYAFWCGFFPLNPLLYVDYVGYGRMVNLVYHKNYIKPIFFNNRSSISSNI